MSENASPAFGDVGIVDVEFAGMNMPAKDEAEVTVSIAWLRPDDPRVRTTLVGQRWKDDGGWKLVSETYRSGARGLLGDPEPPAAAAS